MKKIAQVLGVAALLLPAALTAQQIRLQGAESELIAGPESPSQRAQWLDSIQQWRLHEKDRLQYSGSEYNRKELSWVSTTFMYAQIMAHDRYLYDPVNREYTVGRFLDDLEKRYGGLDAVLIWPTYPNIGIDNRNQFDLVADLPGGKEAVKQMIRDFHQRGVRVFFPIMIWDHGTRKITIPMAAALTEEMKELGADGLNGDTMNGVTFDFKEAYTRMGYPLVLQPEIHIGDLKMVAWNTMSWGYYWLKWGSPAFGYVPGVSLYKWLEPRHQVHVTDRWSVNKTDDLQSAFFNGIGYNTWENIWGIWNQLPERYAAVIRRIRMIYRQFPEVWSSEQWEPHILVMQPGVFASAFPGKAATLYTFINRDSVARNGLQITLAAKRGWRYYDVWNGIELHPVKEQGNVTLRFNMEAYGYGAVAVLPDTVTGKSFGAFLNRIRQESRVPLSGLSADSKPLMQRLTPVATTTKPVQAPEGMILIPAAKEYRFESHGVMIEGNELPNAIGVQYPWEAHPQRDHQHTLAIPAFYIDRYPVTNQQFKQFMDATRYRPADDHNFLKDWQQGTYPAGWEQRPVTWVSIEDARAYAAWAGKRLPHEWEWQYAAQGNDKRLYPWGMTADSSRIPPADTSRERNPPPFVNAYPAGASPFGVMALTGHVWQWTDEYTDAHTRSAVLKGGSYYHPQTSYWYFPQAQQLTQYGKYLLLSPGMDRAGTLGFRCVADY
ncbi:formylglycine-generating enzyme family protein [Chitinophaga polysaccharea]|uniref:formylglycine-generating enzyme family protein n=1 Tax=Chitinophaga polysaccharea TaxID=1293035 RepID=UPI001454EE66|nr:SUMF1/EgtB/PvdO family nonheme iron enzyme [Chitinophaga polysaccharea]NLR58353.1 formylglycine-generating enzyme family protein [Chitinophaga polysaccharea]